MNDSAQRDQATPNVVTNQQNPPLIHQQNPVVQPVNPVGSAQKEYAPIVAPPVLEHVQKAPHEAMPEIPKEAASHMELSPNPVHPTISDEDKKLGAKVANESLAAPTVLSDDAVFPLSAQQVTASQTKEYSVWDSFKWYGKTVGRQMLRRIFLKKN